MIALKLTEPSDDLKIPPEQLFQKLLHSAGHLDTLLKDLNCSPEDLAETLTDPRTINLLRFKAQLATVQVKLLAIHYMPHAIATLVKLTDAEKPEVARRSATTLLNMAGIPTDTKSQPPTLTLDKQEEVANEELTPEERHIEEMDQQEAGRLMKLWSFGAAFQKLGFDVKDIERCNTSELVKALNILIDEANNPQDQPPNPFRQ